MARITPTLTLMVRSLGPIRPNLHLLRGLTSFSDRLMNRLRESAGISGRHSNGRIKFSDLAGDYPHLKQALATKGIKEINFSLNNKTFLSGDQIIIDMIKKSIRIIMRELDTHGRPTEASTALLYDYTDREQVLESEISLTAKSSSEIEAAIKLHTMINTLRRKSDPPF